MENQTVTNDQRQYPDISYPDLYPSTAPQYNEYENDAFGKQTWSIYKARQFCTLVVEFLESISPETNKQTGFSSLGSETRPQATVPLRTTTINHVFLPSSSHTTINNNNSEKSTARKNDSHEKKENEKTSDVLVGLAAVGLTAIVVPVTAHYIGKDYKIYTLYKEIEELSSYFKSRKELAKTQTSVRVNEFVHILKSWKQCRSVVNEVLNNMTAKASGGAGVLSVGLSVLFGSVFGLYLGGATLVGSLCYYAWKSATKKPSMNLISFQQELKTFLNDWN